MRLLTKILLICCVGSIISVKDIPRIKRKVSDAIDRKKSMLLDRQEVRKQKRAELIDELLDLLIEFFIEPPEFTPMINHSYITLCTIYSWQPKLSKYTDVFDFDDLEEILEMLAKKKFLVKIQSNLFERIGKEWFDSQSCSLRGPAYKLSKNLE